MIQIADLSGKSYLQLHSCTITTQSDQEMSTPPSTDYVSAPTLHYSLCSGASANTTEFLKIQNEV